MRALDEGFFRSRWDRATDAQKEYLQAMAAVGDEEASAKDIAARLHMPISRIAPRRAELITKGLIYSSGRGMVAFTVPKMGDYIRRHIG
jgi:predicted Rossmann fold nucleotide-binding protein DprA/Smf involved in DNA uptake